MDTLFSYPYLPFLVFFARICDVTLGTLRVIFVSKGQKYLAPVVGFCEVLIWVIVISEIFSKTNDFVCYVAYAGGYATGSFIGISVEERIALGTLLIRVYTKKLGKELVQQLNRAGFGATITYGEGVEGEVGIVQTVINRTNGKKVEKIISDFDSQAFYVVTDVRTVRRGIFPDRSGLLQRWRLGK